ncbi:MAG: hypothetical protein D6731_08615 [Planctomycetota bacterium]|nr:MAG: hypothetical protein D6731_08615 [Planctomycetota bacterium]
MSEPSPDSEGAVAVGGVQFFGQYLLAKGLIGPEALREALDYQRSVNIPLGALALSKGLLTEKQVLHVHTEQRRSDRMFGEIAVLKGFMTRQQLDELLREQKEARVLLGDALVRKGYLSWEKVAEAYKNYQAEQAQAEAQVQRRLQRIPNRLLVDSVIQMSTRMLLRMGGQVSKLAAVAQETRLLPREYTFWQEVEGDLPFAYYLSIGTPELLALAHAILRAVGEPEEDLPQDVDLLVLDVGKEFVNIVVGHVCTRLSHDGFSTMPLPPDHAEGEDFSPTLQPGASSINVRLVLPLGDVAISIRCEPSREDFPTTRIR